MIVLLSASLNMSTNLENQAVATGMEKVCFHSNAKECSNYDTIALTSQARKGMLKILQARGQYYITFQMFKLDLEKAEEPDIKLPTSVGPLKKEFQKTYTSALLIMPMLLTVWIIINCGKFWK